MATTPVCHPTGWSLASKGAGDEAESWLHDLTWARRFWTRFKGWLPRLPVRAGQEFEWLLESSGGKFTDALEREAERRILQRQYL